MQRKRVSGFEIMRWVREQQEYGTVEDRSPDPAHLVYVDTRIMLCDDPWGICYYWTPEEVFEDYGLPIPRAYSPDGNLDGVESIEFTRYSPCKSCKQCLRNEIAKLVWDIRNCCGRHSHNYFATLTFGKQFRMRFPDKGPEGHNEAVRLLGLFFNNLRHQGVPVYFWVQEDHKDGTPHFHMVYSTNSDEDIAGLIKKYWTHGISHIKKLEHSEDVRTHANYMAKYMFKNGKKRWRRSHGYSGTAQPKASSDGQ